MRRRRCFGSLRYYGLAPARGAAAILELRSERLLSAAISEAFVGATDIEQTYMTFGPAIA